MRSRALMCVAAMVAAGFGCGPGFVPFDTGSPDTGEEDSGGVDWTADTPDDGDDADAGDAADVEAEPSCGNGIVEPGEDCDDLAPGSCETSCLSTGTEECAGCVVLACLVPDETCNNADDDCDTAVDDGLADCRCTTEAPWDHEECNDIDDDCDGEVDEGLSGCRCTTDDPLDHEDCNGIDDDCDGAVDEDLADCRCTTGAAWDHEECNDIDDDCDGSVDEGLTACRCTTDDPLDHEDCNGIDDDCDGAIDQGLVDCGCRDGAAPTDEVCDRIDNDCDGSVDEENRFVTPTGTCNGFGEACVPARQECSSGICEGDAFEHYCSEACDPSTPDPPCTAPDYRCYDDLDGTPDGTCLRNYDPCDWDGACGLGEVCTVQATDDGTSLVTECRPALNTNDLGDVCGAGLSCGNDICYMSTFCSEVCRSAADCGAGWECVMIAHRIGTASEYIPQCMEPCGDDADCTVGTLTACQPGARAPAPYLGTGYCSILYTGTDRLPTGGDCDHTAVPPRFCEHAICSDSGTGVCTEVCIDSGDCQLSGWTCVNTTVTFAAPIGSVAMRVCDPP